MAAARPRRTKIKPKEEAAYFASLCKDKDGFDVKYINSFKGRGVFSCRHFEKGDFLVEYRGELLTKYEHENRQRLYHDALKVFMFEFRFDGKQLCVDAANEDGSLGRLVNDDHENPNSKMKTIKVDGKPHLCLFALKDISLGEEITYNYGDSYWPWRCKISSETDPLHVAVDVTSDPISDNNQQISSETDPLHVAVDVTSEPISDNIQKCKHDLVSSTFSSLEKCVHCGGPFAPLKWLGLKCEVCSCFWHKSCYVQNINTDHEPLPMDALIEMDSSTLSASIGDQPSSTCEDETPPLTAETSKSELSKKMSISCQGGSGKKYSPTSDAHEDAELFSNSGSGEEYQPSSTPSSSDDEALSEQLESSTHRIAEKDHHCLSSSEHDELETKDQRTKAKSLHLPEQLKVGKKQQGRDMKQKVTINTRQKFGEKTRGKAQYCVYCEKPNVKIARHLQRKHEDEADVAHAFSFPVGSKERKMLLEALRNKGNWQHNLKVFKVGNGEIVTWKRPSEKASVNDYLPCPQCYALFKRTELWRHEKTCRVRKVEKKGDKRGRVQKASSLLLPIKESSDGIQNLIHTMLQDKVTSQIRNDTMICKYGDALFARKGREQSQHRYIAQKMRELGRFVLAAKEIDNSVHCLKDMCDPTKFDLTIKAARRLSNYSPSTTEYGKPSTAVKIGFSLKSATEAWIGHCLMTSDVLGEKKAKKFKELLDNSWSSYVSTNAHSTMEQRRWNNEDCVPLTEDVITLQNYLRKIEDESKAELKKCVSTTAYKRLCESLLAQVIVFNKKREGEASRLTLETYLKADTGPVNKDIYDTLTPVEQQMSHRLTRIVTRGKRGRKVPILFLERTRASLDFLIKNRSAVGILEDNPYLFARIGTTTNIRGCDCLRKYAEESKASNPGLLRSTKLRKHVATLCQLLDLDHQELEQVARFMGHDIRVHCEYYRQTDRTFQVAKIGKLLFAMEQGVQSLKGKSLKSLDSVVTDKRHETPPTKGSRRGKEGQTSVADRLLEADDDGDQQHLSTTSSSVERQKKTATKRRHDGNAGSESDVEEQSLPAATPYAKGGKKTVMKSGKTDRKIQVKRPWTKEEKDAVQQRMTKFIALKKVPAKNDCLLCISKVSPVLSARTWKDVKYFVYNEIIKTKRKLEF